VAGIQSALVGVPVHVVSSAHYATAERPVKRWRAAPGPHRSILRLPVTYGTPV